MARTTTQDGGVGHARRAGGGWLYVMRWFGARAGGLLAGALASLLLVGALASAPAWAGRAGAPSRLAKLTPIAFAAETPKAPKVVKQPLSTTGEEGQSAACEATASGSPAPTVQWEVSTNSGATWSPVEGGSADQLTVADTKTSESGDEYRAVFKNTAGEATSKAATLTVHEAPAVTEQPTGVTVEEGQGAAFEAAAAGVPAPTVQWERSTNGGSTWANVTGATSDRLTIASAKTSESGQEYRATFKNVAGKATSEAAVLTVRKTPAIVKQPISKTVDEGANAIFEASASGFPAPTVQWEVSTDGGTAWSPIPGETFDRLAIEDANVGENGYEYRAVFTNVAGEADSEAATLTVQAPALVTEQPASMTVEVGQSAMFEAAASGFPTPTVQWEASTNGGATFNAVEGATSDQLTIADTKASESGDEYRAVFTNVAGKATSGVATLTVATTHYSAVAWGQNLFRQLGDGSANASSDVPVDVTGLKFVTAVAGGGLHSLALLANGTVQAWGDNEFGQLGDGSTTNASVPVAVSGLADVKAIAAGEDHSLALLDNGTVMAWGDNESGQLGDGNDQESEVPVAVKGLTGVKAIAAGGNHSMALLSNGAVQAWGDNESGELGNASTKSSAVPVAVKGLSGVSAISAGGQFSLALLSNGTVQAWGANEFGQLGTGLEEGEEERSDVPIRVEGLSGATSIAAGSSHSLALVGGGTVMAWGEDNFGELGNGKIEAREGKPVAVSGLSGVVAISAGGQDSAALLSGGSVMTWGINRYGELGDGTSGSPSDVPVLVSAIGKVASISAGGFHMLAFGEPKPAISSLSPNVGSAAGQTTVTLTGSNFDEATAVHFGANAAVSFEVTSDTTATAVAPAGMGTVDVTITTPAGVSATGAADRYTYVHTPTVSKLSTKSGPVAGHTSVTITGTEFTGVTAVSFGAAGALHFTVVSPTSITAEAPPGTAGTVDVIVTNAAGPSAKSAKDHFEYTPTVESVAPDEGSTAGGTSVTVTGTGFATASAATTFKFATKKATSVQCASTTSCTMVAPAGTAGTVNVTAQVNKAISPVNAPADDFTYN
ncbi:MAG TPA: IPT/TIG domain-containing protein [Solirubrobacteraceae bacterium]|nr:IPT/TIG domain-containing protein [Solirubrobacteraceae bacterium]